MVAVVSSNFTDIIPVIRTIRPALCTGGPLITLRARFCPEPNLRVTPPRLIQGGSAAASEKFVRDVEEDDDDNDAAIARSKAARAVVRPKYVRRQRGKGSSGGGGGAEEELSFWVRVGVVLSGLISRAKAPCSLCRGRGRKAGVTVRGTNKTHALHRLP